MTIVTPASSHLLTTDANSASESSPFDLGCLQTVMRHLPMVIFAVDGQGIFSLVEGGALSLWQSAKKPCAGLSMYDFVEDSPELVDGFEKALSGHSQRCRTYVGERIFELSFSPVPQDGQNVRACCVAEEITERAESEKQRVAEQLASFERQRRVAEEFRALIESLPLGIVVTCDQRIVFSNPAAQTCMHWADANAYLGADFSQFFPVDAHPAVITRSEHRLELVSFGELQLTTADSSRIIAEVQAVGIEFEGAPAKLFALRDVSQVHRMEQDLRQSQRLEAIGRLAAGIAHEINTPIQFIGDNASFLAQAFSDVTTYVSFCEEQLQKQQTELDPDVAARKEELDVCFAQEEAPKAVANILEGVGRVAKIVSAMKAYAHPGSAEKSLSDINRALETTVVVATNEWKHVANVVTDLGEIPPVPCHLGELNQVFLNLIVNAAHAIGAKYRETEDKGHITIRTYLENGMVVVAIEDDGTGMAPAVREHIFDPFFTTKEVGRGTGQGLTLARRVVVDQHGGQIDFSTEVDKGSTFFVRLPLDSA